MALAVDRFDLLYDEISRSFSRYLMLDFKNFTLKDWLAFIGTLYIAHKSVKAVRQLYNGIKLYGVSKLYRPELVRDYGPWAVVTGSTHGIGRSLAQELASCGMNIIIVSIGERDCKNTAKQLVVAGCTAGIGKAYATELAAAGINVVLVSRSTSKLFQLANFVESNFGVQTKTVPVDFNEGKPVYDRIQESLQGKEIGILVNNVGVSYEYPQYFLEVPEEMTHMVLPQMVERGRGAIITVSSGSSIMPTPLMTVYSATKAYLDIFTQALEYEYRGKGITIQCLMPFYVATRMSRYSSTLSNPSLWIPTAATYARQALYTLGWSHRTTGYWPHTVQSWLLGFVPENLWLWGSSRLNFALRRQADHRIRHRSGNRGRLPTSASSTSIGGASLASSLSTSSSLGHIAQSLSQTSITDPKS